MRGLTASGSGEVYPSELAVQEPELLRLVERVRNANGRLSLLNEHLEGLGFRLFGPIPTAGLNASKDPQPSGSIALLNEVIDALHDRITEAENNFSRLGGL